MKALKELLVVCVSAFILSSKQSNAQEYNTGIGFRAGGLTSGLTVKHFTGLDAAVEGIASFGFRSFVLTGLYEKHNSIRNATGLKWLYGSGAHIGFFSYGGYYYIVGRHGNYIYYTDRPGEGAE